MKAKKRRKSHLPPHLREQSYGLSATSGTYFRMQDDIGLVSLLKDCAKQKDLENGSRIHAHVLTCGLLKKNVFIGSSLVNLYAKCGALAQAQEVFDMLSIRNVVAWTALIAGYAHFGHGSEALACFQTMKGEGVTPNEVTFACVLKACGSLGASKKCKEIHDEIARNGFLKSSKELGTALVDAYAKCGDLTKAHEVFDDLPARDVVTWTALIGGYCHHRYDEQALDCFECMQSEGLYADAVTFTHILQACGNLGALEKGAEIHAEIVRKGFLSKSCSLGNALVSMYAKCGAFLLAQQVLGILPFRDSISWTSLIAGYTEHGYDEKALEFFKKMLQEGIAADEVTLACILQVCGSLEAYGEGEKIHADIVREGVLERDSILASALIDMYVKCGALMKAQKVLIELSVREVVSWTALIVGYAEYGLGESALDRYKWMQGEGVSPDPVTLLCILQVCGTLGKFENGNEIYDLIIKRGLEDCVLRNATVAMYAKCGALEEAQRVFDALPVQNIGSWRALIGGYCEQGRGEEALKRFDEMQHGDLCPDVLTLTCTLMACSNIEAIDKGKEIHSEIIKKGSFDEDRMLGTALLDMYAKCGALSEAQQVFEELSVRDKVSWTALISGYARRGEGEKALYHFQCMHEQGHHPDAVTLLAILKACSSIGRMENGAKLHAEIARKGLWGAGSIFESALVTMYAKGGAITIAQDVFNNIDVRNVISWTALIAGYANFGLGRDALNCLERMKDEGIFPNAVTFACLLKACGSIRALKKGEEIHDEILKRGLLGKHMVIGNALVDMYAKCGELVNAQQVFDELPARDVISWTALVAGYCQFGRGDEAFECFEQMQHEGINPNLVTFSCLLKVCGIIGAVNKGKHLHNEVVRQGLLKNSVALGNSLICMYANCGLLANAWQVLNELPFCSNVSWTLLIGGCIHQGRNEEALRCYLQMQCKNVLLDSVTFACILQACGGIGAVNMGKEIHAEIGKKGCLEGSLVLGNALVDMYGKCNAIATAQKVFDELPDRDVVSWNALITGYARVKRHDIVVHSFHKMIGEGIEPSSGTFMIVLKASGEYGFVDEYGVFLEAMSTGQDVFSTLAYHTCLVKLLSNAGQLDKAFAVIKSSPVSASAPWWCLLDGCQLWGNAKLGRVAYNMALQVDAKSMCSYAIHSGMKDDIRSLQHDGGVWGVPLRAGLCDSIFSGCCLNRNQNVKTKKIARLMLKCFFCLDSSVCLESVNGGGFVF